MNNALLPALIALLICMLCLSMGSNSGQSYEYGPPTWKSCNECPSHPCKVIEETENSTSYECGP